MASNLTPLFILETNLAGRVRPSPGWAASAAWARSMNTNSNPARPTSTPPCPISCCAASRTAHPG